MIAEYFLFGAILVWLILTLTNQRFASPVPGIFNRWTLWAIFSVGGALVCKHLDVGDRPMWALVVAFGLIYFVLETGHQWLLIHDESLKPSPIFPRYQLNLSGEEWPTNSRVLKVRDWLRQNGYRQVQALREEVSGGFLRCSVYQDAEARERILVTFLPLARGTIAPYFSISSQSVTGMRYVTDNNIQPFGGFYPENWLVERRPWCRSLARLMKTHRARVARAREVLAPWTIEPLGDLNSQQRELEKLNTELGFLLPLSEREEHGKLTHEGRYRMWKELWLLNYFGRATKYE